MGSIADLGSGRYAVRIIAEDDAEAESVGTVADLGSGRYAIRVVNGIDDSQFSAAGATTLDGLTDASIVTASTGQQFRFSNAAADKTFDVTYFAAKMRAS